jgi:pimeloyl-ACP methyl ester carboxylesterase
MRRLGQLVLLGLVLVLLTGVVFYERPVWVALQGTHFGLFLARVQSNYVLTPEGRVHYYEGEASVPGGGIPLVLVHGLADRDESWALLLKRLSRAGFHVYAPDLLGYGRSPKPADSDYSVGTQEKFVADFIQALGLQKPDIGGWSMGGWIVLKLALDHPEMVDRVVVYDPAGITYDGARESAAMFHPTNLDEVNRLLAVMEPEIRPLPPFVGRDGLRALNEMQPVVDKGVASMLTGKDILDGRLQGMTEPLLIVWGGLDRLIPLSVGQSIHGMVPTSELDVVEGCGHLAPKTCSGRVAAATADFLKAKVAPQGQVRMLTKMR